MMVQDDSPDHRSLDVVSSTRWGGVVQDGDVVVAVAMMLVLALPRY